MRIAPSDSLLKIDSLRTRFIPIIGSFRHTVDSSNSLHSSQLVWSDGRSFADQVWRIPGFFLRNLGEQGKPSQLNGWGSDWRSIAVLIDGRPLNDPITGTTNLSEIPIEFIDQVDEYSGIHAPTMTWNSQGSALNLITKQYNSLRPITKLRYSQSPNNTLLTDGLFTQNLLRGLNFMLGFQREVSDGRFEDSRTDNWNVRTRLRYNFSQRLNIALTDFYTKTINGQNGGVNPFATNNIFDEMTAVVNNATATETVARRDVSLLAIAQLFDDTASTTHMSAFYTNFEREYNGGSGDGTSASLLNFHKAEVNGLRLQQSFRSTIHHTDIGFQTEHSYYTSDGFFDSSKALSDMNHAQRDKFGAFVSFSTPLLKYAIPVLSLRWDKINDQSSSSMGYELRILPGVSDIELSFGYSQSYRYPSFQEASWEDSSIFRSSAIDREKHRYTQAGIMLPFGWRNHLSISAFDRRVDNAILIQPWSTGGGSSAIRIMNIPESHSQGIAARLELALGPLSFQGTMLYTRYKEADSTKTLIPDILLGGELTYRNQFFRNALDAKFGIRSHSANRHQGMNFHPQMMTYTENRSVVIGRWTRLDVFAVLRIGDATVTLAWENLLDANYWITSVYPMPGRGFRLGVNWTFLD
jgi:outer membrane cobalamin receptor